MDTTCLVVRWCRGAEPALAGELIRAEAARRFAVAPGSVRLVHHCPRCGSSRHGRPALAPAAGPTPPQVSISRAEGLTVVALTDAGPVGVDVERSDAAAFGGFDAVGTHRRERPGSTRDRTVRWVRKESLLKATGDGLAVDPTRIRLTGADRGPALLGWDGPGAPTGPVWMADLSIGPGYVAAVTVLAAAPADLDLGVIGREDRADRGALPPPAIG